MRYHIYTHLSGRVYLQGSHETAEAAQKQQAALWLQGWYYVPLMDTLRAREQRYPLPANAA